MPARYYDFAYKGWRFIVLDTTQTDYPGAQELFAKLQKQNAPNAQPWSGGVDPGQKAWLAKCLEKAAKNNEKVIVFGHIPLYPVNVHNLWNDGEIIEVLESAGCVVAYINGHNHGGNYGEKNGIHYLNLAGMVETADQTAYAVIEIYSDRLNVIGTGREPSRVLKFKPMQKNIPATQPGICSQPASAR
jgi:3',5'-cyclic AMP phosphodiesterase CpdA